MIDDWEGERVNPESLTTERLESILEETVLRLGFNEPPGKAALEDQIEQIREVLDSRNDDLWLEVAITNRNVNCSFPMREDAIAISDTCQRHATSTVVGPHEARYYRCPQHEGQYNPSTTGKVHYTMSVRKEGKS
jgi:hypothetical protein